MNTSTLDFSGKGNRNELRFECISSSGDIPSENADISYHFFDAMGIERAVLVPFTGSNPRGRADDEITPEKEGFVRCSIGDDTSPLYVLASKWLNSMVLL